MFIYFCGSLKTILNGCFMNCDIKVSVIIPIYNAYDYLRPALDSVVYQTLRDIEIICIDDGSVDRSLEILKEYQKNDDRVRIVTEANAGPGLARNNGLGRLASPPVQQKTLSAQAASC